MSLSVVATPIGNLDDITLRAIKVLREADVIVGEEYREVTTLLKRLEIEKPQLERLNEHSKPEDVADLLELCRSKRVALVSDCGTPGFCDPGADLVEACRRENIEVLPVPGASSLMALFSVAGRRMQDFVFQGFLPAKKEARTAALKNVAREKRAQVLMDTPYRLKKLITELAEVCPTRTAVLGLDMTQANESYLSDSLQRLSHRLGDEKREFVLLIDALTPPQTPENTRKKRR